MSTQQYYDFQNLLIVELFDYQFFVFIFDKYIFSYLIFNLMIISNCNYWKILKMIKIKN